MLAHVKPHANCACCEWIEIAAFEFKAAKPSKLLRARQLNKSLRVNAAILWHLRKLGLDISKYYPIIADGKGAKLDLYALRHYEDVLGAGWAVKESVVMPTDELGIQSFLQKGSLLTLLAWKEQFQRYVVGARKLLALSVASHSDDGATSSQPMTPPSSKRPDPFVLLSPTKKGKHSKERFFSLGSQEDESGKADDNGPSHEQDVDEDDEEDYSDDDEDDEDDYSDDDEDDEEDHSDDDEDEEGEEGEEGGEGGEGEGEEDEEDKEGEEGGEGEEDPVNKDDMQDGDEGDDDEGDDDETVLDEDDNFEDRA
ncbi:hypothetical protein DFQ27_000489 [Actinomortierella ambigua]|uniref:Uncharacterized protein n=1 Tax=Actinomortierella ambigua TaxID=1343610 RepID=A0A9P6TW15_9FUNG|nr:hypothetical protein DFQ27_000489 [Actinomortierella ambigua]